MLRVEGLSAGYGAVEVIWEIDLEVREGEIVALVGSNGAGKTTLLRAVSGLVRISDGEVRFEDAAFTGLRPEQIVTRGVAHVPEGRHLFEGLTVRENLLAGGYAHRDGADLDRAVELFPKLGERMSQLAGSLSGGEQQMCAIARGLMSRPKLLMIDELSLGLAPKLVDEIMDRLRAVAEQGTSLLVVEQDVDAALRVAGRGYVLETGRVAASGSSEQLAEDPRVREAYLGVA
ncbi:MAG: branched-chain amino acid transport system ATP-binding protein [Thermoleophilaceae bacterium]|nr:branched-chain amino acid transport system ATP-binding protein [Thermoleophilaceae bacterium]